MIGKIFKAYDIRAVYPEPLNEDVAWRVGYAAGQYIMRASGLAESGDFLVSRDMRPSSESLCEALSNGIRGAGPNVIDLGRCDTSFMYFAINHLNAVGGIQTTASHNPIEYNGFKLSGQYAKPIGASTGLQDIEAIVMQLPENAREFMSPLGSYRELDLWEAYQAHVLQYFAEPKRPLKIVIDACNAMGGDLVPKVFGGLANVEVIPLNFEITGKFEHEPNPLVPENMVPTQEAVLKHGADLGVCFDGDADRCMITDEKGQTIGCDHLTALLTEHYFAPKFGGESILYDLRSSKVVEETITRLGCKPVKSKVGHVNMKALLRGSNAPFGGELSGHFYFRDNFFADSGAMTYALVLNVLGQSDRSMSELVGPYQKYPQSGEQNFHTEDKDAVIASLQSKYGVNGTVEELDGVSIDCWDKKGYWFNVRASNTEPLLRLNAEAKDDGTLKTLVDELFPMMGEHAEGH